MIHHQNQYVFLHIPRTSGVSLTCSVMQDNIAHSREADFLLSMHMVPPFWRHARAALIHPLIANWDAINKFSIMRNPWRCIESHYRFMRVEAASGRHTNVDVLKSLDQSFELFLYDHFSYMNGGFWKHWCLADNGDDLGVECLRYESLDWQRVQQIVGSPTLPRLHVNASPPSRELIWTDTMIDFVRLRFADDFTRFDYPDHPHGKTAQ